MKKFCVLKPVAWNTENYQAPCGARSSGENFVSQFGYGHEEWNNHPSMNYNGRVYFHSEAKGELFNADGNLCIILIAAHQGTSYIVGVGAEVAANSQNDRSSIAKILNVYDRWQEIWAVPLVQKKFGGDKQKFLKHWNENYEWIMWSCPESHFHWFKNPIPIITSKVTDKQRVVAMFGSYQLISPAIAIDLLAAALPKKHPILDWLTDGEFEEGNSTPNRTQKHNYKKRIEASAKRGGANRPTDKTYEYLLVEGKRVVNPKHAPLQAAFVLHLQAQGVACEENTPEYIDILYKDKDDLVITEVKPAESVGTKYAIRAAVGQLLEYRHVLKQPSALLHIVLDEEPKENEIEFVKSLGFLLSCKDKLGGFKML